MFIYTYMHATITKKETMNLKEIKEGEYEGFGGRKWKRNDAIIL